MAILIECECGRQVRAQDSQAGRLVKCPACGQQLQVPEDGDEEAAERVQEAPRRQRGEEVSELPSRRRRAEDDEEDDRPRRSPTGSSGKSMASLVCGILSFCVPVILPLIALLLGFLGLRDVSASRGRLSGKGMAIVGIILAITATAFHILGGLIAYGTYFGVTKVQQAANQMQSQNNLKQIGIAMQTYEATYRTFPPAAIRSQKDGKPLLSWRVALLPYLEDPSLYQQFKLDEPWDSPTNSRLVARMPPVFAPPPSMMDVCPDEGYTFYRVFVGPGTAFEDLRGQKFTDITDGTSNTWAVVEAGDAVPWTKPEELTYSPTAPLPRLGGIFDGDFNAVLLDGSVRHYKKGLYTEAELRSFITRNGNEVGPRIR